MPIRLKPSGGAPELARVIFEDVSGRRAHRARWVVISVAMASIALAALATSSAWSADTRTALVPRIRERPRASDALVPNEPEPPRAAFSEAYAAHLAALAVQADEALETIDDPDLAMPEGSLLLFGVETESSREGLVARARHGVLASPDWLRTVGSRGDLLRSAPDGAAGSLTARGARVLPRLANLDGDRWTSEETSALLASADARARLVAEVVSAVEALGADGINLDFEALAPEDASPLVMLAAELRTMLHRRGRILTIDVTFGDPGYDLPRLARAADALVLMAYDEHHGGSAPGPIASRGWLEERVGAALAIVPRHKLVVALGAYAMDWQRRGGAWDASSSSVPDALTLAATIGAMPSFREGNLHFAYDDAQGRAHEVWCLDAASIADARGVLARLGVTRTGLWRIGTEDPSTWSTLEARSEAETLRALARIEAPTEPHVRGQGELIARTSIAVEGSRRVALDEEGLLARAELTTVPSPQRFERMGATESRQIVLTFDDGPDPEWTPRILEVLAAAHAPATFFAVGAAAAAHPDLVRRLVREGNTVASHTYDHPHMDALDASAARRELERTARVLEALTGQQIHLYRAPYTALFDPTDPRELAAHSSAFDAGYLYVAASIDPHDWETRTAAQIADAIVRGAEDGGHVVVLHDGGGDRSRTVRGLELALPVLAERGYEVVSLETYAGLPRGSLTPPLPPAARARASVTAVTVHAQAWGTSLLSLLFAICTALAALRVLCLAALVAQDRVRRVPPAHAKRGACEQPSTSGHGDRACLQRVTRHRAERALALGRPVP